jgi:hypothetical protein
MYHSLTFGHQMENLIHGFFALALSSDTGTSVSCSTATVNTNDTTVQQISLYHLSKNSLYLKGQSHEIF